MSKPAIFKDTAIETVKANTGASGFESLASQRPT